jgi:hypothetical protein
MSSGKRIFFRLAGGILVFLVLLAALIFLLPLLSHQDWFREKIAGEASALVGGTVRVQVADLSYLPRPHLTIRGTRLEIPGTTTGTIRSLAAYPRILPLLWGTVRVSEVHVEKADFTVTIPEKAKRAPEKGEVVPAPASLEKKLRSLLDSLARSVPDLKVVLTDGRVDVSGGGFPLLSFRGIEGSAVLPPTGPKLDLSCAGTLWERGSVKGAFEAGSLAGKGQIVLKRFRPHLLAGSLLRGSGWGITDSDIDLDLRVKADGWAKTHAEGDASLRRIALYRGKRRLEHISGTVRGSLDRDGEKTTVALTQLSLDSPRLLLSGDLVLHGEAGRSRADATARQVDIASVREHALALAGDVSFVTDIFSIVKGGTIPVLAFHAKGETADDLWELENIEIEGRILEGKITVDAGNADLDIDRVQGSLALSKSFLAAKGLEGNVGKITARRGTLRMGLLGSDPPFHLEADVSADAAELPPLLTRLVPSESFRKEISRMNALKGNASGRLTLGETLESIQVAVKVDAMNLSAEYDRLPYPLTVSGGRFLYRGETIAVNGARGEMGNSTFSGLDLNVRISEPPSLEIRSGMLRLSLGELTPWARKTEGLRKIISMVRNPGGTASLSVTRLEGPALAPSEWKFDVSGNVEQLSFSIPSVPGTIEVAEGTFRATPESLFFEDLRTKILGAAVSASGSLGGYREKERRGVATVSGRLGPEAIGFLYDRLKIPLEFLVHPPLEASGAHLEWEKGALEALSGDFTIGNGPKVSVDLLHPPGEWVIRDLSVLDEGSKASLSLHWKPGFLDLSFDGHLGEATENRIFTADLPSGNMLKGNFRASLRLDRPMTSTAQGTLEGNKLDVLQRMKIPVFVDSFALSAEGSRVEVQEAKITIGENRVLLKGEGTTSPDGLALDMDASTPGLDWENLQEVFGIPEAEPGSPGTESEAGERGWSLPVHGKMRLTSGYFRYGERTVEPVSALIDFGKSGATVTIAEAAYCGIHFTGTLRASDGEVAFEIHPAAKGQEIESSYVCGTKERLDVSGRFDLAGVLSGRLRKDENPLRSLRGNLELTARDGRIYKAPVILRILSLLNITDIFRGGLTDMGKEGLPYRSFSHRVEIEDGKATGTGVLDSTVDMIGYGTLDLVDRKYDLQVLVTPTTTMNAIIRNIPVLGYILGGTLIQIPVGVTGTFEDPKVSLLEPAAVGKNLLGIVERTFLLPVKLIRPVLPGEESRDR